MIPYAMVAAGVAFVATAGYAAYQYQRAESAATKQTMAEGQRDRAFQAIKDQEAQMAEVLRYQKILDDTVDQQVARLKEANAAKQKLRGELDEAKKPLPQADKDCLDRQLPLSLLERLRKH